MPTNQLNAVTEQDSSSRGIVDRILKNDVVLHSSEMLRKLLKEYPNEPGLIRVHEDQQKQNGILQQNGISTSHLFVFLSSFGRIRGYAPIGMMENWNDGMMGKKEFYLF